MRSVAVVAALVGACLPLVAGPAQAARPPLDLIWTAPPGCPSAEDVRHEIARQLNVPPERWTGHLRAEARVERVGDQFHLRLHTVRNGVEGDRELDNDSCELLARSAAVVLAIALYEDVEAARPAPAAASPRAESPPAVRSPAAPAPAPTPAPEAVPPPPPEAPPPTIPIAPPSVVAVARPTPSPAPLTTWTVVAEGRLSRGPLPGLGLGFGLGIDVGRGPWIVALRLEGRPPTEHATADAEASARYSAWGGSLSGCAVTPQRWRVSLAGCAGVSATALFAASSGALSDGSAVAPWYAASPAARARVHLFGAVHAELGASLAVSLNRPRFALRHLGDVHEVPRFVPGAAVGLSLDL